MTTNPTPPAAGDVLARQVAALTERAHTAETRAGELASLLAAETARVADLGARVAAVDARHHPDATADPWCVDDGFHWPCATHRALHPEDDQ